MRTDGAPVVTTGAILGLVVGLVVSAGFVAFDVLEHDEQVRSPKPTPWSGASGQVDRHEVVVSWIAGPCAGARKVLTAERESTVTITLYLRVVHGTSNSWTCPRPAGNYNMMGYQGKTSARLAVPIGTRRIIDGACAPEFFPHDEMCKNHQIVVR